MTNFFNLHVEQTTLREQFENLYYEYIQDQEDTSSNFTLNDYVYDELYNNHDLFLLDKKTSLDEYIYEIHLPYNKKGQDFVYVNAV